jgi:hypothetical protein
MGSTGSYDGPRRPLAAAFLTFKSEIEILIKKTPSNNIFNWMPKISSSIPDVLRTPYRKVAREYKDIENSFFIPK